jgi:hypothetical protein
MNTKVVNKENMVGQLACRLSLGSLLLLAIASGCTTSAGPNAPSVASVAPDNGKGHKGGCSPKGGSGGGLIYTAQLYGHDLNVYSRGGSSGLTLTLVCTLTNGVEDPDGTVTTQNGWWYVANGAGENVLIYRTKHGLPQGPVSSLSDYDEYPANVDTNPSRKLVAVSNFDTVPSGGGGSVSVYVHRQSVPERTLSYGGSGLVYGAGVAVTHGGDCYWAFNANGGSGPGTIVEFAKCSGTGTLIYSGIPQVGGITFDQSDNLYYVNSLSTTSAPAGIYTCTKTSSCGQQFVVGSPFATPTNMNFDYKGHLLWVVDPGAGYIFAVDPKSKKIIEQYSTTSGPVYGIAPEPG